jgi:hypothetical protein
MLRTTVLVAGFAIAAAAVAHAQKLPAQPPPVASPLGQGNDQERAACHPDVVKYCQSQLQANPDDVLGILGCLQGNRPKISAACQQVLASHGV